MSHGEVSMIKIIISQDIYKLMQEKDSLLKRQDIIVFPTGSNDETLKIHLAEKVNLIITELDMPGIASEFLYNMIRKNTELRMVAVLMICPNNNKSIEQCSRCMVDAVILRPVNPELIMAKAQHLLDLSLREASRVRVPLNGKGSVHGNPVDTTLICCSDNISSTGVLLDTENILNQGDQLVCSLCLPDKTQVQVTGEIVRTVYHMPRSGANQYGVRFFNLTAEAKQLLETFINSYVQLQ
jgi:CheY-like chemotaxis protein